MVSGSLDVSSVDEAFDSNVVNLIFSTGPSTFDSDHTINLTLAGTATKGPDYTINAETLTLAAGASEVRTYLTVNRDNIHEPDETILILATLDRVENIIDTWILTIEDDDDAPTLSVSVDPASIAEAAGTSTLTVSTARAPRSTPTRPSS